MAKKKSELNIKQKNFCREYLIDLNATKAGIRAGYSEKTAYAIAEKLLKKAEIQNYLKVLMDKKESKQIAKADEVLQLLTKFARGEEIEECIVTEGVGGGVTESKIMTKKITPKDRLKALGELCKYHKLGGVDIMEQIDKVVIVDDIK